MRTAIYPGSFNPWHAGHLDILHKAQQVFDQVIICQMLHPDKEYGDDVHSNLLVELKRCIPPDNNVKVTIVEDRGLLVDAVERYRADAVIRGLRNGTDLQYEQNMQYLNEDLGLKIPTVYFVCDRRLGHISSSALRGITKFKKNDCQHKISGADWEVKNGRWQGPCEKCGKPMSAEWKPDGINKS